MEFTGDAFHADKKEHKVYGTDIKSEVSSIEYNQNDTLESKTNTVSNIKSDGQMNDGVRNLIAVTDSFIAYSIRSTMIRIINTITTDKAVLRGHAHKIVDLKFSIVPGSYKLCSVDDGTIGESAPSAHPHIHIWTLKTPGSNDIQSIPLNYFTLPASFLQPHPQHTNLWLIATNRNGLAHIGILNDALDGTNIKKYTDLPVYIEIPYEVLDISFSEDGTKVAVVVTNTAQNTQLLLYQIPSASSIISMSNTTKEQFKLLTSMNIHNLISVKYTVNGLITASMKSQTATTNNSEILVQVYNTSVYPPHHLKLMQTIHVNLPLSATMESSWKYEYKLSCTLCQQYPNTRYVILYHRQSNYVVSFHLNPTYNTSTTTTATSFPLSHMTMIDLKYPVESLGSTVITGQDHHSAESIEHLEFGCFQPLPYSQATIQQFHVPLVSVSTRTPTQLESSRISDSGYTTFPEMSSPSSLQQLLAQGSKSPMYATTTPTLSALLSGGTPSSSTPSVTSPYQKALSPRDFLEAAAAAAATSSTTPSPALSDTNTIIGTNMTPGNTGVGGGSLLKMLKNAKSSSSSSSMDLSGSTTNTNILPDIFTTPVTTATVTDMSSPSAVMSPVTTTATPATATATTATTTTQSKSVLGLLKRILTPSESTTSIPTMTTTTPAVAEYATSSVHVGSTSVEKDDYTMVHHSNVNASTVVSAESLNGTTNITQAFNDTTTTTTATIVPPTATITTAATNNYTKEIVVTSTSSTDLECTDNTVWKAATREAERTNSIQLTTATATTTTATDTDIRGINTTLESIQNVTKNIQHTQSLLFNSLSEQHTYIKNMKLVTPEIVERVVEDKTKKLLTTTHTQLKNDINKYLEDTVMKTQNEILTNMNIEMNNTIKKSVEKEVKKMSDMTLKSKSWTDDLVKLLHEQLKIELQTTLSNKLPDMINTAVRDTVKGTLSQSFKQAFETSLVPSFQVGTERMFTQIGSTVENSMQTVQNVTNETVTKSIQSQQNLQQEVEQLKMTIASLESKLDTLLTQGYTPSGVPTTPTPIIPKTPIDLYKEGLISDAFELALENKNINILVELLSCIQTSQVLNDCDSLLQLCAAQQLAADFAIRPPIEGTQKRLEWIKTFVLKLLSQPVDDPQIKAVFKGIMTSLQTTIKRIEEYLMNTTSVAAANSSSSSSYSSSGKSEGGGGGVSETATREHLLDLNFIIAVMSTKC